MKVVCIDGNKSFGNISLNSVYDVINMMYNTDTYTILDDDGQERAYVSERFKLLSEIRDEKITKILE